jgi:NAD(P)H-dependent flavin oxidoreductase YrpB (nitropropane dioxygenase family)
MKKQLIINGKKPDYPLIQGGMGIGISFNRLVTAVIKEGCVGTIASAQAGLYREDHQTDNFNANKAALQNEIKKVREKCPDGILGVNVMHALHAYKEQIEYLGKENIDFIVSGAGLPTDLPEYLKDSEVKPAIIVSNARVANVILRRWDKRYNVMPEFIVVEGPLAGGHLGFDKDEIKDMPDNELEKDCLEVIETVKPYEEKYNKEIPVIAAGGIFTSEEIRKFLDIGCAGVQIATRFIATEECDAHENYKKKIIESKKEDIVTIDSPVGYPARCIKNNLWETVQKEKVPVQKCVRCLRTKICDSVNIPYCITDRLTAAVKGDVENGLVFTGAEAYRINKMVTVKELIKELVEKI